MKRNEWMEEGKKSINIAIPFMELRAHKLLAFVVVGCTRDTQDETIFRTWGINKSLKMLRIFAGILPRFTLNFMNNGFLIKLNYILEREIV